MFVCVSCWLAFSFDAAAVAADDDDQEVCPWCSSKLGMGDRGGCLGKFAAPSRVVGVERATDSGIYSETNFGILVQPPAKNLRTLCFAGAVSCRTEQNNRESKQFDDFSLLPPASRSREGAPRFARTRAPFKTTPASPRQHHLDSLDVRHHAEAVRPERDPGGQEPEHRRKPHALAQRDDERVRHEDYQDVPLRALREEKRRRQGQRRRGRGWRARVKRGADFRFLSFGCRLRCGAARRPSGAAQRGSERRGAAAGRCFANSTCASADADGHRGGVVVVVGAGGGEERRTAFVKQVKYEPTSPQRNAT